jgi:hypothetical protein
MREPNNDRNGGHRKGDEIGPWTPTAEDIAQRIDAEDRREFILLYSDMLVKERRNTIWAVSVLLVITLCLLSYAIYSAQTCKSCKHAENYLQHGSGYTFFYASLKHRNPEDYKELVNAIKTDDIFIQSYNFRWDKAKDVFEKIDARKRANLRIMPIDYSKSLMKNYAYELRRLRIESPSNCLQRLSNGKIRGDRPTNAQLRRNDMILYWENEASYAAGIYPAPPITGPLTIAERESLLSAMEERGFIRGLTNDVLDQNIVSSFSSERICEAGAALYDYASGIPGEQGRSIHIKLTLI